MFTAKLRNNKLSPFARRAIAREKSKVEQEVKTAQPVKPEPVKPVKATADSLVTDMPGPDTDKIKANTNVSTVKTEAPKPKGRPRSKATMEREAQVLKVVQSYSTNVDGVIGVDKGTIAEETRIDPKHVYAALKRLKEDGRIVKIDGRNLWKES